MKLIPEWRRVLGFSWTVRLSALASVLSAIEVYMQMTAPLRPEPWFAAGAALAGLGAAVARLILQMRLRDGNEPPKP